MALHLTVLGIDGSGKSTVTAALPPLLAGALGVRAGGAGDGFLVADPDQDHLAPRFAPEGLPLLARLARLLKRLAKALARSRLLYPLVKLAHLLVQDAAARRIARRYRVAVMVSDGNAPLSSLARAANYRWPARLGLRPAALMRRGRLPDMAVFLDLSPEEALDRIGRRGRRLDPHENLADLTEARRGYREALDALVAARPDTTVLVVPAGALSPGEILARVLDAVKARLAAADAGAVRSSPETAPLGTSERTRQRALWLKLIGPRYVLGYLVPHFFRGAWRELTFLLSRAGRTFLKLGYSAEVMRLIYEQEGRERWLERAFLGYPLHRAVYDRLQILARRIEPEIERRLADGGRLRILTGPSGFAYDLFRPLGAIARRRGTEALASVEIVATDLDPHGTLGPALRERAARIGVRLTFLRADLTDEATRASLAAGGLYDLALFVGVSAWLPKPATLAHLAWLSGALRPDGVLVSDCFSAESYALSGRIVGYKAQYYAPGVYRALADSCGFDGQGAQVESGRDRINHVIVARPRAGRADGRLAA